MKDDGDFPAEAARQPQGQQRPVVDVQQIRPGLLDEPGDLPVVEGKIIPVAAVEPPAPALQGNAVILRLAPGFLARQVGVRHPDDHRPPVGEMVRHLFDEQLRRPAPDGRDGKEFGADQGYGGHGRRPLGVDGPVPGIATGSADSTPGPKDLRQPDMHLISPK